MKKIGKYTKVMIDGRQQGRQQLSSRLIEASIDTKEQFFDLMQASFVYARLNKTAMADHFGYSMSSVSRWINGLGTPHKILWPQIKNWIIEEL